MANRGDQPGRLLEIAYGVFDEADIERLDDDYARHEG
jgi:mannose-6-phosphate isomerase